MIAEQLNADRVKHWLDKTSRRIAKNTGSTDMGSNSKLSRLCSRYNDLKDRALELGVWSEFCKERGVDPSHDGFDCAA